MPHPPKYLYEPTHADSVAALSRLGRSPSGGAQTVGVFRFRGNEPVRIDCLDDNTFVAIRLDAAGERRGLLDRLLDVVRSLFRLEGAPQWRLAERDCREMESWMFALSARAMQQEVRCRRQREATRARRDASTLSALETMPPPLLRAIGARLSPPDCHALRQVCSRLAKPMAHCVPLLHATSWTTLAELRGAVAQVLPKTADAPFAVALDRSTRAEALTLAASRIAVLPRSQRCTGLRIVLDAIQHAFPDGDGGAAALCALASQFAGVSCIDSGERQKMQNLAHRLCRALERLPLAERIDAALQLRSNPLLSISDRLRTLLLPDSCWVLAARVVPAMERCRVIDYLAALVADSSRVPPAKAVPMALQALQLAQLDPAACAHALSALFRISDPAMLAHDCRPTQRGGAAASGTDVAVWERLMTTATAWPNQAAAILVEALMAALSALPDQDVKNRGRLAACRWLENATDLPSHARREIEVRLFALLTKDARLAAWNAMWDALLPSTSEGGATEADARQIARCLWIMAGAGEWEPILLPRLAQLPAHQRAALLASLPAHLYRGPHTMALFECVVDLAAQHGLLRPLALWYRARTLDDYGQYSDALNSALICLPNIQQAQWIVALSRDRVVPELWIDVGLAALEQPLPSAALQASLIRAVVAKCHGYGVRLDEVWQTRIVCLTRALTQLEATTAGLNAATVAVLIGLGDALLRLHDGMARPARPGWAAEAIPPFVAAGWRWAEKLPFASLLSMIASMCVVREPVDPAFAWHFHLTTVRHAMALLPRFSPRQQGDLLPLLIQMESGPKGARPVDWRGFDSCRQALWQAIAALPARERARAGVLGKVSRWFARAPADAGSRQAWREARRQYLALTDDVRNPHLPVSGAR